MKPLTNLDTEDNSTLDNLMEGFQLIGFDWRYLYINEAVVKQSKCNSKEDLLGYTMMEKFIGIEKTELFTVLQKCMKERISANFENEFTFPDNSKGWFELRIEPVPKGIFILSMDITERKKIEETLLKSLERFNYATLASSEIIYDWMINDNTIWWNDSYYELMRVKKGKELLSIDSWSKLIHPEDYDRVMKSINDFIESNENLWFGEYRFLDTNGEIFHLSDRAYLIRDQEGKPFRMIGAATNISLLKQTIFQLEEILFSISHKVRQPVAHILGISNLLDKGMCNEEELIKIVGYMKQSSIALDTFTKELTEHVALVKQKNET